MAKTRQPKPTLADTKLLQCIAQQPLLKTRIGKEWEYSLSDGSPIHRKDAERLINNGWLKGNADGLFGDSQTFSVKTPPKNVLLAG